MALGLGREIHTYTFNLYHDDKSLENLRTLSTFHSPKYRMDIMNALGNKS